jgi:hypothetical protein
MPTVGLTNQESLGVFLAVLISYPICTPISVTLTGERGHAPTRGYEVLGKAGEGEEWGIKLRFQSLGAAECDSCMRNHTRRFFIYVKL